MTIRGIWSVAALGAVLLLPACRPNEQPAGTAGNTEEQNQAPEHLQPQTGPQPELVAADLSGRQGSDVSGVVSFTQAPDGVQVVARVDHAPPGKHGLHLHENGDCSAADFASAGGHFNPTGAPHGGPDSAKHHAGDFGNIEVGPDGTGTLSLTTDMLSLAEGAPDSVLGRSVVLHAGADDLTSQPSGNSGERIACGAVRRVRANVAGQPATAGGAEPTIPTGGVQSEPAPDQGRERSASQGL